MYQRIQMIRVEFSPQDGTRTMKRNQFVAFDKIDRFRREAERIYKVLDWSDINTSTLFLDIVTEITGCPTPYIATEYLFRNVGI